MIYILSIRIFSHGTRELLWGRTKMREIRQALTQNVAQAGLELADVLFLGIPSAKIHRQSLHAQLSQLFLASIIPKVSLFQK